MGGSSARPAPVTGGVPSETEWHWLGQLVGAGTGCLGVLLRVPQLRGLLAVRLVFTKSMRQANATAFRHCERSAAIHACGRADMDGRVAAAFRNDGKCGRDLRNTQ